MSCRQHCVDVYTSSKDGVGIRETKAACIQSCEDNVKQFKDNCAVEVAQLRTVYTERAKRVSDSQVCYDSHCQGFTDAQAARTAAAVNSAVTAACTTRCADTQNATCKATCAGGCDAAKMLAC